MRLITGGLAVAALGLALVGLSGCAQDNETAAQITGVAPTGAAAPKTQAELQGQMRGAAGGMNTQTYPGAAKQAK